MSIVRLSGSIQNYAWGSRTKLAEFQGRQGPTQSPEAELWYGAHPQAPSALEIDGERRGLDSQLSEHPVEELGNLVAERFGRLPFLLKVLAVERPLSIQVHPSAQQAKAGFEKERERGIAASDPRANYRDDWPKPELLCPLTPFEALCGFRSVEELIPMLTQLGGECFDDAAKKLAQSPNGSGLRQLTQSWLTANASQKSRLYASALEACARHRGAGTVAAESAKFALALAETYPGDTGVLVALLLERWSLRPGEGLFVPAGVMHSYLHGVAVEVMASSDNVLRGGLTPKHVDVPELLNLVNFDAPPMRRVVVEQRSAVESVFVTESPEFGVSRIEVASQANYCARGRVGPEMILCLQGQVELVGARESLPLSKGQCAWISANEDVYCLAGEGAAVRVQVGA